MAGLLTAFPPGRLRAETSRRNTQQWLASESPVMTLGCEASDGSAHGHVLSGVFYHNLISALFALTTGSAMQYDLGYFDDETCRLGRSSAPQSAGS